MCIITQTLRCVSKLKNSENQSLNKRICKKKTKKNKMAGGGRARVFWRVTLQRYILKWRTLCELQTTRVRKYQNYNTYI